MNMLNNLNCQIIKTIAFINSIWKNKSHRSENVVC